MENPHKETTRTHVYPTNLPADHLRAPFAGTRRRAISKKPKNATRENLLPNDDARRAVVDYYMGDQGENPITGKSPSPRPVNGPSRTMAHPFPPNRHSAGAPVGPTKRPSGRIPAQNRQPADHLAPLQSGRFGRPERPGGELWGKSRSALSASRLIGKEWAYRPSATDVIHVEQP